jgi:hypothetical protein
VKDLARGIRCQEAVELVEASPDLREGVDEVGQQRPGPVTLVEQPGRLVEDPRHLVVGQATTGQAASEDLEVVRAEAAIHCPPV